MKMKFNIEKLVELGLIRRIPKSRKKAEESMRNADSWLKEAVNNLESETFRSCIISCYLAMFHAARAILFIEGYREKSHFAVARFLEDRFVHNNLLEERWIELLDHYRELRHSNQYSTSFIITQEEVEKALSDAKAFVKRMKKLMKELIK